MIPRMGADKQSMGLGDALFTKTQRKVLGLLFGNPDRTYYVNELVRLVGGGTGAVKRELDKLHAVELITLTRTGNQKHYQANAQSPLGIAGFPRSSGSPVCGGCREPARRSHGPLTRLVNRKIKPTIAYIFQG